jgi:cellulose synthase (UDP-forming)
MSVTTDPGHRYRGSHRRSATKSHTTTKPVVLPAPPDDHEKYLYIGRNLPFLAVIMVVCCVTAIGSQIWFETASGMWPFGIFTAFMVLACGLALPLSFSGRGFDLEQHIRRVGSWRPGSYPDVDIYLPICAESMDVLRNTWEAVFELCHAYPGTARPYVLDDGADPEAEALASDFGFNYAVRPDRGKHKKSGNLRYAYAHTFGEFFVILDADFAPRPDFLAETLPYFDDPDIAIVQTPQYFRTHPDQTWVERAAGAMQEIFYRVIQVTRDRLGAAICVGTCAVYRSIALAPGGGPTLIAYAEDVHTGLDVRRGGWQLIYVPVLLATGTCPSSLDMFVRQQYRWCRGATSTVLTSRMWTVPMSVPARLSYVCGLAYYAQTALAVFMVPLIPVCLLAFRPITVSLESSRLALISIVAGAFVLPVWTISGYDLRDVVPLMEVRGWAHALAFWDWLCRRNMTWTPSGGPVSQVRRFRVGAVAWNGSIAAAWLALACLRTTEFHSPQFAIITGMGVLYAASVCRLLWGLRSTGS